VALPNFLIIGAFKCGTTSLHHYLNQHPEIQMPAMKETDFFSGPANGFPYARGAKRIKSLGSYERLFDATAPARGEASPNYTDHPRRPGTAERIRATIPEAKLIYLVRDPIARTLSHFHHRVSVEGERRSLSAALSDLTDRYSPYTCPSFYASQLERYLEHFPQEQILVVDQDDLLNDRASALREIFDFLSVDRSFESPRFADEENTSANRRSYSRFIVLVRRARATPVWSMLPTGFRRTLRRSLDRIVTQPLEVPTLDDSLRDRLRALYEDDARRLRALTGKAFPSWTV